MFNLIIVLISVALVIGLTIVSVFYAGDIVSESKTKAVAATFDNQASQIYSASLLYYQDKGTWPVDVSLLYLEGKKYLSAEISPPATMADRVKGAVLMAFAQTTGGIVNGSTELKPYVGDANAFMATMVQNKALTEKRLNKIKAAIGDDPEKLAYIAGMYNETPKAGELKKTDWAWSDDSDIPAKRYVKVSGKVSKPVCKHVNVRSGKAASSEVEVHKVFDPNYKIQCFGAAEPYTYLFLTPEADPQVINSDPPPESLCSDGVSRRDGYGHCPCTGKPWYPLASGVCPESWKATLVAPSGVCSNPTASLSGKVSCPPGGGSAGGSTMHDYGASAAADLPMSAGEGGGAGNCPLLPAGSLMALVSDGAGEAYIYSGGGSNHKFSTNPAQVCKCEDGSLPVQKGTGDNRYAVCNPQQDAVAGACPAGYTLQNNVRAADYSRPSYASPYEFTAGGYGTNGSIGSSPEAACQSFVSAYMAAHPGSGMQGFVSAVPGGYGKFVGGSCRIQFTGYQWNWVDYGRVNNCTAPYDWQAFPPLWSAPYYYCLAPPQYYCRDSASPTGFNHVTGETLNATAHTCTKQICVANTPVSEAIATDSPVADSPKDCAQYASQAALATACHNEEKGMQAYLDGLGSMAAVYQPQIDICQCEWVEENGCDGGGACTKTSKEVKGGPNDCGPSGFLNQMAATAGGFGDCDVQRNVPCGSNGSTAQAVENFAGAATGTAICTLGGGLKFLLDAIIPGAQAADGPTNRDVCEAMKSFNGAQACRPDSGFLGMKSADNPDTWTKNSVERKRINLCESQCAGTLSPAQQTACDKLGC